MVDALKALVSGREISKSEAASAMRAVIAGQTQPEQVGAFLALLHLRPVSGAMLAGFASAFREHLHEVALTETELTEAIDVCGTGGDGLGSFNISTAVAFVSAAAGQPVAKHGNRAVSSRCGSFDVIEALGVPFADNQDEAREALKKFNLAFLYAPSFHPALRKMAPVRKLLGFRTVFNVLGPLLNPARVRRQLIGVYAESLVVPVAEALAELGVKDAIVVHGLDGSDEISLCAPTRIAFLANNTIATGLITPEELGLARVAPETLLGGEARENARIFEALFSGERGPKHDIVALNAAAAFVVGGRAADLREGLELARKTLAGGQVRDLLERMRAPAARGVSPGAAS